MPQSALILGAGQIGQAVAARLLQGGWTVTLASRGNRPVAAALVDSGARQITLDRDDTEALRAALGTGTDLLLDTIAYGAEHGKQLTGVGQDVGALAVISSASVYRDDAGRSLGSDPFPQYPVPISESQPTVAGGDASYSTRKVALEQAVLDASSVPVIMLRPAAIHGIASSQPREWWFVKRMLDGRELIPLAYSGESTFHTSAAANIAALLAAWAQQPQTMILNSADPQAPTVLEIGQLIAEQMGYRGRIVPLALSDEQAGVGGSPWSVPAPVILDTSAAEAIGYRPAVGYAHAVVPLVEWLRRFHGKDWKQAFPVLAKYPVDLFDYDAEDRFFAEN